MLHQKTINSNIQIFPSFQIVVEFEFQTWLCVILRW
jgi:hypothetical protein